MREKINLSPFIRITNILFLFLDKHKPLLVLPKESRSCENLVQMWIHFLFQAQAFWNSQLHLRLFFRAKRKTIETKFWRETRKFLKTLRNQRLADQKIVDNHELISFKVWSSLNLLDINYFKQLNEKFVLQFKFHYINYVVCSGISIVSFLGINITDLLFVKVLLGFWITCSEFWLNFILSRGDTLPLYFFGISW
jgi:hypothetical protein